MPSRDSQKKSTRARAPELKLAPLQQLFEEAEPGMQELFVKVINLHAAMQIQERSPTQMTALVRKHIEESLPES